jgi:predicted RND superfamily exporter protein
MIRLLTRVTTNHPMLVILLLGAITIVLLPGLFQPATEVSVENFLPQNDPAITHYQRFLDTFGNDNMLVAFFGIDDPFSDETLGFIKRLSDELRSLKEVSGTFSLADAVRVQLLPIPMIRPLVTDLPLSDAQRVRLRDTVMGSDLYRQKVVTADGKTAIIIIFLETTAAADDKKRLEAVRDIEQVITRNAGTLDIKFTGSSLVKTEMSLAVRRDFTLLAPIVVAVSLLFLWLAFRSFWALVYGFAAVGMTLIWTMSVFFLAGFTLNMATILLPSLVMALSFSQVIFIMANYQRTHGDAEQQTAETVRRAALPCFLAALTTAAGFLSLTATSVLPVRDFGVTAAFGISFAFLIAILFVPSALRLHHQAIRSVEEEKIPRWCAALSTLSRRRGWILAITGVLLLSSVVGIFQIRIDTSPYRFFPPSHYLNRAREAYLKATGFEASINLMVYRKDGQALDGPAMKELAAMRDSIARHPLVADTLGLLTIGGFVTGGEKRFIDLLGESNTPGRGLLTGLITGNRLFRRYLSSDGKRSSFTIMLRNHAAEPVMSVIRAVEKAAASQAPDLSVIPTGQTVLFAKMVDHLFYNQVSSVFLILSFVTAVFVLTFRSIRVGLISLVTNLTPILFTLGLMGWLGIPLNIATVMVSGIAVGISVDSTIHFLHSQRGRLRAGAGYDEAIDLAIRAKARPIIFTSLLLASAFLCYLFSSFMPVFYLGALTALTMIGAMIGALVLLPALLRVFRPKF